MSRLAFMLCFGPISFYKNSRWPSLYFYNELVADKPVSLHFLPKKCLIDLQLINGTTTVVYRHFNICH